MMSSTRVDAFQRKYTMNMVSPFVLAGLLALTTPAFAQSAFDGVWKVDLASARLPDRPHVQSLQNGLYTCSSCVPAYSVPADGEMHEVEGFSYWDETSIRIVDGQTVEEVQKLDGRPVGTSRSQVSADGSVLTTTWTDTSAPDGTTTSGEGTMSRIAIGAAGSHAISGSWKSEAVSNISEASLTATMHLADGVFSFRSGTGYSYEARLGGPGVPITGDLAGATATVRQLADGSLEETDHINGEATSVMTLTPARDGSMVVKFENLKVGTTTSYNLVRQ